MARMRKTVGDHGARTPKSGMAARVGGSVRRDRASLLRSTALQASFALVLLFPVAGRAEPAANARPQGGSVVAGSAAIVNSATLTAINQSSPRAAINWTSFDVGAKQAVRFNQPSSTAITLNRVTGSDPSQIAGQITANGTIVLTNPSGVVFSQGAQVNAQTVLVTTADISNQNFMAGKLVFDTAGKPNAMIVNQGTISVAQSGLAALVAPSVANSGTIIARMGTVILAGAATHTVDLYGDGLLAIDVTRQVGQAPIGADGQVVKALVTNTGVIRADGGTVVLTAQAVDGIVGSLVDAGGRISADSIGGRTGTVVLRGVGGSLTIEGEVSAAGMTAGSRGGSIEANATNAVTLAPTARVSASGMAGGGTIALGTTLARAAGGPSVTTAATAKAVTIAKGAQVSASATVQGDGGRVTVLSTERTDMAGSIVARAGAAGGDGGFVEVSGYTGYSLTGTIDVSAALGKIGSILIDPKDLTITAASPGADDGLLTGTGILAASPDQNTNATISAAAVSALTGAIVLEASQNLIVNGAISMVNSSPTSLTLRAGNDLTVSAAIGFASGSGNITLQAAQAGFTHTNVTGTLAITANVNAGSTGVVTLLAGTGGISVLGATVSGGSVVANTTGGLTLSTNTNAGTLTVGNGGTLSLAYKLTGGGGGIGTGNRTGTLSAGTGGVLELADSGGGAMTVDNSLPGFGLAKVSVAGFGTIRLGSANATVLATTMALATATDLTGIAPTLDLQASTAINVTAGITATSAIHLAAPSVSVASATNAGALIVSGAGTLSLLTDAFTAGIAGATLSTAAGGVVELASRTAGALALDNTLPGFGLANVTLSTGTLRVGQVNGTTTATTVTLATVTDLTGIAGTLDVHGSGAFTQAATKTLKVATLTGSASSIVLGEGGNAIGTIGGLSATAGNVTVVDSAALTVAGVVTATGAGASISLTDSAISSAGTAAIAVVAAGTLTPGSGATAKVILNATDATTSTAAAITLAGVVGNSTATVDLSAAKAAITQTGGTILAATLTSSSGALGGISLTSTANAVSTLGAFNTQGGDFQLVDSVALTVNGLVSTASARNLRITDTASGGITLGDAVTAGTLAIAGTGTLSLRTDQLFAGTTAGTLTAAGGVFELASNTPARGISVSGPADATKLVFNPAAVSLTSATLRLGRIAGGAAGSSAIGIDGATDLSTGGRAATLDLQTTASVTQAAALTVGTLTGTAGTLDFSSSGANQIGALANLSTTTAALAVASAASLTTSGLISAATDLTLTDSFASTAGHPALAIGGTLSAAGTIKLVTTASTTGITAITLGGTIGASGTTLDLSSAGGDIVEGGATVLTARRLISSGGITGNVTLIPTTGSNAVAELGALVVTSGTLALTDTVALSVVAGATAKADSVSLTDSFASVAGTPAITVAGTLQANTTGTVSLTASATGTGVTGISLTGTLGTPAGTIDLVSGGGDIVQTATGVLNAASLTSSGAAKGAVTLAGTANAVNTLGAFDTQGGDFVLVDSVALTVAGMVTNPGGNRSIRVTDSASGGILIGGAGGFALTGTGTIALKTDSIASVAAFAALIATSDGTAGGTASGTIALAPNTAGRAIDLGSASTATNLGFDTGQYAIAAKTLRLGTVTGTPGSSAITVAGATDLTGRAATLEVQTTVAVTQSALLKVGTFQGAAGGISLNTGSATIGTLGDITTSGAAGFVLRDTAALVIAGTVTAQANGIIQISDTAAGGITLGGAAAAGKLATGGAIALSTDFIAAGAGGGTLSAGTGISLSAASGGAVTLGAASSAGVLGFDAAAYTLSTPRLTLSGSNITIAATDLTGKATSLTLTATGTVSQTGALVVNTLNGSAASVDLTTNGASNQIAVLSGFGASSGNFLLSSASALQITGAVTASTPGQNIRLVDSQSGGITLGAAGALSVSGGGTISLSTDRLAATAATAALTATGGVVELATVTAGRTLALGVASSASQLGFDPTAYSFIATALRLGQVNGGSAGSSPIRIAATDLTADVGTLDLRTTAAVTQSGTLQVGTLTGAAASVDLTTSGNSIAVLGSFGVASGDFTLTDTQALTVTGKVTNAGLNTNIRVTDSAGGGIVIGGAGGFAIPGTGTIALKTDSIASVAAFAALIATSDGTSSGTASGTIALAPNTAGRAIDLGSASTATNLGFDTGQYAIAAKTLRLGTVTGTAGSSAITVAGATNLTGRATTLDLQTTGTVTQTAAIAVDTLTGIASGLDLGSQAGNQIAHIVDVSTASGDLSILSSVALATAGTIASAGNLSLADSFASTAGTAALTIGGTLSVSGSNKIIALGATTAAVASGITGIAIAGQVGTTALATSTTTIDLHTAGSDISDASGGVLLAQRLISSAGLAGNVTLASVNTQIAQLGNMASSSGTITLLDKAPLSVVGTVTASGTGASISLTDTAISSAGTAAIAVLAAGTLTPGSGAAAKVILNATDATTSTGAAITLAGVVGNPTATVDLSAARAAITQTGGTILAATLTSGGGAFGGVSLTSTSNAITGLGAFHTQGGDFLLTDAAALAVTGLVDNGTAARTIRLTDTNAAGITIQPAGTLAVQPGATLSLQTGLLASGGTAASLSAPGGAIEFATNTAGQRLELNGVGSAGTLSVNTSAFTIASATLRLGEIAGVTGSSPIVVAGVSNLSAATSTLDLRTSGAVSQISGASLTVGTLTGDVGSVVLGDGGNAISVIRDLVASGDVGLVNAAALSIQGATGLLAGRQSIVAGATLSLQNTGALTVAAAVGNGGSGAVSLRTVTSGDITLAAGATISSGGSLSINSVGTYGQSAGLVNAPVVSLTGGTAIAFSGGTIAASSTIATYPALGTSVTGLGPSITLNGGAFTQSGGLITANGTGARVTVTPTSFSQSAGVLASDGSLTIGAGNGLGAGVLGSRASANASFNQSGGRIVAGGDINVWSSGTLSQVAGTIAAGGTLGATSTLTLSQGNTATTSAASTVAVMSGAVVLLHSISGSALQGGDGKVLGGTGASNDPTTYPIRIQAPAGTNSFSIFGDRANATVTAGGGFVVFCPSCNLGATAPSAPTISAASLGGSGSTLPDVVLLGDVISPLTTGAAAGRLALYSQHDTTGTVSANLLTGRAGILTQDAANASPYPLPDLVKAAETTSIQGTATPYWSTASAVIGNVSLTGSAVTNLGTSGFGYGATGSFALANTASSGTLTVMAGQGASVYPGVMAWGGTLSLGEAGNLVVAGPVGSSGANATLTAGGNLTVTGSAVVSAGQTLTLSAAGTYTQSAGLVNAPVVSLTGTGGVTLSAGAIMAAANVQGFPNAASTASGLTPSIAIGGGGFIQSGGTISAAGTGASVTLTPASFSQSGGVLSSDGDLRIGSGSNAGLAAGVATATNGIAQSGGVIAAAGNVTLYSVGGLTQTAGVIAAGGTLAATVSGDISQGNTGLTSATTPVATLSGPVVHVFSTGGNARQGGDGLVAGATGASADPLSYPIRIEAPVGVNSFSVFGTAGSVTASPGYVVFAPSSNVTASGGFTALPATPSVSLGATTAALADVVLLGDVISPLTTGAAARDLALYSRHDTTGKVAATLLTGRAGILTQDATNASPYPLPDLVRAVETAGLWSTASAVIGNVSLTGSAIGALGTITVPGTTGFGYGATGSFSLANVAPASAGNTLTVMAGGVAGSTVYPGIAAWGGPLSITEAGAITVTGPVASITTLSLGAGANLTVTASAVLGATTAISLTTAGTYLQDSGLVNAPFVTLASTKASGTGIAVSGGTLSATGPGAVLTVTSTAAISQTGGVIASDGAITLGTGAGAGTVSGVATATSAISQTGGTIAAAGNLTLYTTGTLTQTSGLIAAGGTLAATATGDIVQGNPATTSATTTVAAMTGSTVALFSTGGAAQQGGDGIVAANPSGSVDPGTYQLRIQSPTGANSFSIFGTAASLTAGSVAFNPAGDVSPAALYRPLTTYTPAHAGAIGLARTDVALLGDTIAFQSTGVAARNLALYSRHATQGLVNATLLTGRAGVLTTDTSATPDFVVPALVKAVETAGFWSTAANVTDGNFFLPNSVTNGSTIVVSAIQNLGTTVAGVNYGIGATGSFNLDNKAPGGTLTVAGGLMAWTGGVRINAVGSSDVMLITGDINVASPGNTGVPTASTAIVPGLLSLTGNSITLGKPVTGSTVTLQAAMLEITGKDSVKLLDGVTIDTAGDTFTRPPPGVAPKDPQKLNVPPVHMPGALFSVGLNGFTQSGTFTMAPYIPTAYKLSGQSYTPANHPVLEIVLTQQLGTVAFDPGASLGLAAPKIALVLDLGAGNTTGHIDADTLALFYTQQTGVPSTLFGTLRTALGTPVADQAAASQAFIAQNIIFVPSNHFQINGCALSSVNCVLTALFPQIPIGNPFKDLAIGRFNDPLDDPDLLLPNVSDRDY